MEEIATRFLGSWVSWAHGESGSDKYRTRLAATRGPTRAARGATDGADLGVGTGAGPPPGSIPRRGPRRVVGVGVLRLLAAPGLGTLGGRPDRPRRARAFVGLGRAGGPGDPGQAGQLPPVRPRADGRRSSSAAPSGGRDSSGAGPDSRVSAAHPALPSLRSPDRSRLAAGVSRHTFGPSVQAWVGLLAGTYRMSKRNIVQLLADAFGVRLSVGTVSRLEQAVAAALARPVEEARAFVRQQATVHLDETGWRPRRAKAWLWTAVTEGVSVFAIRKSRGRDGVEAMLGPDNRAVVGSDRYSAYGHLPPRRRQVCWAHLRRAFEEFGARGGEAAWVGQRLLDAREQLFARWYRVRDGTLQRSSFQAPVRDLRARVSVVLVVWATLRRRVDRGHLRQSPRPGAGAVDLRPPGRGRADQQRRRTSSSSWRVVAPHQLRHPQCRRQPLRRAPAHGARYPAPAAAQRPRLSPQRLPRRRAPAAGALAVASDPLRRALVATSPIPLQSRSPKGLNGYNGRLSAKPG